MSVPILGLCARPDCKGTILADGICHLCTRSVEAPVPTLPLLNTHARRGRLVSDYCGRYKHDQCSGRTRLRDVHGMLTKDYVPCECPHHGEELPQETKPKWG